MSYTVQHKRSDEPGRRPRPAELANGQLGINFHQNDPGLYFKTKSGALVKAGPAFISDSAPAPTNHTNLSLGEMWLDTTSPSATLKFWTGTTWRDGGLDLNSLGANLVPKHDATYTLGMPGWRWKDIYLMDVNLCNRDSSNDVDGTWGNYTIQEGEDNLYLLNRRNGKTYKFVLEEVK